MVDGAEEIVGAAVVVACPGVVAPVVVQPAEVDGGDGESRSVARLVEQVRRPNEVGAGLLEGPQPREGPRQAAVAPGALDRVGSPLGDLERDPLDLHPVVPVPLPIEEAVQRARELADVGVETVIGRVAHGRQQRGVLGAEPAQRLVQTVQLGDGCAGYRFAERGRGGVRLDQHGSAERRVEEVIEQAPHRRLPVGRPVAPFRDLDRVGAHQASSAGSRRAGCR